MMAATLAIGLAVGYAVGHGQGRGTVATPVAPPASIDFGPVLTQDPGTCSVQAGHDLELGIPVTNQSGETVLLESVKPVPLVSGLLKVLSWRWDPCGFDNDGIVPDRVVLGPGETTWVTAVVQPLVACPGPAPLQFQVTYSINSQKSTFNLPGFPDLSAVRYGSCPNPAA
jgi:hypothetical protein